MVLNNPAHCIIALDLDGTLLRDDKSVSEFTLDTLTRLAEAGAYIFFTTGRRERIALEVLEPFRFGSLAILNNGTVAMNLPQKKRYFTHYMPIKLVREVIDCVTRYVRPPVLIIDTDESDRDIVMDRTLLSTDIYARYYDTHEDHVIRTDLKSDTREYMSRVLGMFLCEPVEDVPHVMSHLCAFMGETLTHRSLDNLNFHSTHRFIELLEPGRTKWNAITQLKESIFENEMTVLCYGDDHNDIDMLTYADKSFAPSNAIGAAKAAAHEIIPSNEEDGVAVSLQKLFSSTFTS